MKKSLKISLDLLLLVALVLAPLYLSAYQPFLARPISGDGDSLSGAVLGVGLGWNPQPRAGRFLGTGRLCSGDAPEAGGPGSG